MMKKEACGIVFALLAAFPTRAISLNSLVYAIPPDQQFISLLVRNDTKRTSLYTLSAFKIDKPGKGGEHHIHEQKKELLYSPLNFIVQSGGSDYFKIFYKGPADDKERYYRILFKESPVMLFPFKPQKKSMNVLSVVSLSAVLIVRPRQARLQFVVDEKTGTIRNTGNTFFRVIIQKGCNGDDESSTQFSMLPGERWQNPLIKANNKKYIVAMGRYHHAGAGCFTAAEKAS